MFICVCVRERGEKRDTSARENLGFFRRVKAENT